MTSARETTKTKIVDTKEIYNFALDNRRCTIFFANF